MPAGGKKLSIGSEYSDIPFREGVRSTGRLAVFFYTFTGDTAVVRDAAASPARLHSGPAHGRRGPQTLAKRELSKS